MSSSKPTRHTSPACLVRTSGKTRLHRIFDILLGAFRQRIAIDRESAQVGFETRPAKRGWPRGQPLHCRAGYAPNPRELTRRPSIKPELAPIFPCGNCRVARRLRWCRPLKRRRNPAVKQRLNRQTLAVPGHRTTRRCTQSFAPATATGRRRLRHWWITHQFIDYNCNHTIALLAVDFFTNI